MSATAGRPAEEPTGQHVQSHTDALSQLSGLDQWLYVALAQGSELPGDRTGGDGTKEPGPYAPPQAPQRPYPTRTVRATEIRRSRETALPYRNEHYK